MKKIIFKNIVIAAFIFQAAFLAGCHNTDNPTQTNSRDSVTAIPKDHTGNYNGGSSGSMSTDSMVDQKGDSGQTSSGGTTPGTTGN